MKRKLEAGRSKGVPIVLLLSATKRSDVFMTNSTELLGKLAIRKH